jgi:tetratricopeptide (TPR) repeat protein
MASAQMAGDGQTVIAAAEKLGKLIPDEAARGIAMVQPVKAAPYFAHAQFSTPETILALPDPGDAIPYIKAMWLYARGVALARRRDFAGAAAAADAIGTIERTADFKLLKESNVPAQEVLRVAQTLILARIAQANGDNRTAIVRFERAAALQDALPYTEPPYWYYPIRQSLAAALLQAGRYADAERQFQRALTRAPLRRARLRLTFPKPGLATANCCRFPIFETLHRRLVRWRGRALGNFRGASTMPAIDADRPLCRRMPQ